MARQIFLPRPVRGREERDGLATYVLQLDEVSQVALARALIEAPHAAIVAVADPESVCGHLVMADDYEEALGYAESYVRRGWWAAVWDIPMGPRSAALQSTHDGGGGE